MALAAGQGGRTHVMVRPSQAGWPSLPGFARGISCKNSTTVPWIKRVDRAVSPRSVERGPPESRPSGGAGAPELMLEGDGA